MILSMVLGALLHKIYIELNGVTFNIKDWSITVKERFLDTFLLEGKSKSGQTIYMTIKDDVLDFDYAKSK